MISIVKTSLKLLMRNKVFLFFLLVIPVLPSIVLTIKMDHTAAYAEMEDAWEVVELDDCTTKAVYMGNTSTYIVKVYDASGTDLSEYVLNQMAKTGMFSVCRSDVSEMTEEAVFAQAKKDAFDDRAGVLLYLKKGFEEAVLENDFEAAMQIYLVSEDDRQELFETELKNLLEQIRYAKGIVGKDSGAIVEMLETIKAEMPDKKVVSLASKDEIQLTNEQLNQKTLIGYAFAFLSLGFLFCGVCVAHNVIEEQNNKVFTRVMLSKVTTREYFFAKFVVAFIISIMQTLVLAVCLFVITDLDFGISIWSLLLLIFQLGLIFGVLSLLLGMLLGDVMSSNYAVFTVWSISALLAGLYFPLDDTTVALKTLSYLMPQRWFMNATEMLLVGDKGAYSMVLYVTVAYLVVFLSVGGVWLKVKRNEA